MHFILIIIYLAIEEEYNLDSKLLDLEPIQDFTEENDTTPTPVSTLPSTSTPRNRRRISRLLPKNLTRVDVRYKKIYRGIIDATKKKYNNSMQKYIYIYIKQ